MLEGEWVCDECWLDVAQARQQERFGEAKRALGPLLRPIIQRPRRARGGDKIQATSTTPSRLGADASTTQSRRLGFDVHRHRRGPQALSPPFKRLLLDLVHPGVNSICRICSHIFYGVSMGQCTRCGGLCAIASDSEMRAMHRYPRPNIEEDVLS
jgi:hypothetical protein